MSQRKAKRRIILYKVTIGVLLLVIVTAIIYCFHIALETGSKISGECATSEVIATTNSTTTTVVPMMRRGTMPQNTVETTTEIPFGVTTVSMTETTSEDEQTTSEEDYQTTTVVSTTETKATTTTTKVVTTETTKVTTKATTVATKATTTVVVTTENVLTTVYTETEISNSENPDKIRTLYATGYCKDSCGGNNITSSGATATAWHTIATNDYPIGTRIYIPAFKDKPNGGWFVVQDTGVDNKIDIWMSTMAECYAITGEYECHIYY